MNVETDKELETTLADADADKSDLQQAVIVRIMKTRKQITHTDLVTELVNQLKGRFQPQIGKIKDCISCLIEKEYIRREGPFTYSYLA